MNSVGKELLGEEVALPETADRFRRKRKLLYPSFSRTCQCRCSYCVANMHLPGAQMRYSLLAGIGVKEYMRLLGPLLSLHGPLEVFLGGPGEPLISPHFSELAAAFLSDGHRVRVVTNAISSDSLFALGGYAQLRGEVSLHYGPLMEKGRRKDLRSALRNARLMHERGILSRLLVVMDGTACRKKDALAHQIELTGIPSRKIALRRLSHRDSARRYPEGYTDEELRAMEWLLDAFPGSEMSPRGAPRILRELAPRLELRGALCYAPMRVLSIGLDGGLWNCYADPFRPQAQGHLLRGYDAQTVYAPGPVRCSYDECSCRVNGIDYCLAPHGRSLEDYCLAYHRRHGNERAIRALEEDA